MRSLLACIIIFIAPIILIRKRGFCPVLDSEELKPKSLHITHLAPSLSLWMLVRVVVEEELGLCQHQTQVFYQSNCKNASVITLFLETTVLESGGSFKTTNSWVLSAKPLLHAHSASAWALPAVILIVEINGKMGGGCHTNQMHCWHLVWIQTGINHL